ncbi:hypothetical protein SCLCIDRAFT_1214820 [Scleroderma citrinum Foug A]|uniref:Uncharacterized protein n=1 Tax=Scleroderma citrinum Foug A TaxID=1036808 RepID=A0A0C2ZMB7_9AGAM|nr:hypothetical protein SCLCIDRAFT_1214820 [Scleroderma citrinum Foug A]
MYQGLIESYAAMSECAARCMEELDIIERITAHDLQQSHPALANALYGGFNGGGGIGLRDFVTSPLRY